MESVDALILQTEKAHSEFHLRKFEFAFKIFRSLILVFAFSEVVDDDDDDNDGNWNNWDPNRPASR